MAELLDQPAQMQQAVGGRFDKEAKSKPGHEAAFINAIDSAHVFTRA